MDELVRPLLNDSLTDWVLTGKVLLTNRRAFFKLGVVKRI
jgi:hypothetical protein